MTHARILGTGSFVPADALTNDELAARYGIDPKRIALAGHVSEERFTQSMERLAALLSRPPYDPPAV